MTRYRRKPKHLKHLGRCSDFAIYFIGHTQDALYSYGVAQQKLSASIIDIVLQANADVSPNRVVIVVIGS